MSDCRISVIIPTYNRWDNLYLTLMALTLQTAQEGWEVIVGDDGGTDHTYAAVCLFQDRLPALKYFYHPDRGYRVSLTRNRAAKLANGASTHFLFLDSDVVLNKYALEHYLELIETKPRNVICGRYDWLPPMEITEEDIVERWDDFINARLPPKKVDYYKGIIGPDPRTNPWDCETEYESYAGAALSGNLLVPRDIFEKLGGYDEVIEAHGQDCEFGYRLQKVAKAIFCEHVVGYHVNHWRDQHTNLEGVRKTIRYIHKKHNLPLTEDMLP